jgi:CubicO group peptidase (beta-lactamase class C family)
MVLLTCSPLWNVGARADKRVISAWRPTPTAPAISGQAAPAQPASAAARTGGDSSLGAQANLSPAAAQPTTTPAPAIVGVAAPQPASTPQDSQLAASVDAYLNDLASQQYFEGAVLVARNGQVILSKGYGMADATRNIANTPQTRFRLASLTKQFTATAIMILQARGKLNVQDSICGYLDPCPDAWRPITIHQLLTHTSGLPNYTDLGSYEPTQAQPATPAELVARFRDLPLIFAPGTSYMYENSDYVLLGTIVERVSGQSYADFLRDAIFAPLGMRDSGVAAGTAPGEGEATGYRVAGEPAPLLDPSTLFAAGSIYSTVEDMYRWDQALYTTRLLPQALLDAMWTPQSNNYGYGWKIDSAFGRRRIGHPGLIDGFQTSIERFPDDRVTVIVLSNMSGADVDGISYYLASLVFGSS